MGIASTSYMTAWKPKDTYEFLEHCANLGAGGIQAPLTSIQPEYLKRLRTRAEQLGMYVEVMAGFPKQDASVFEQSLIAAKAAGATVVRIGALSGRRYEAFTSLKSWNLFVAESKTGIERALAVASRQRIPVALENHKDWTVDELLAILRQYDSEYLGVLLDSGNNIALLDDPMQVVRSLAPYTLATHIKDMGVEEYPDGFLLAEVPLGEGILDIKEVCSVISKARPQTRLTLEMITRDPLKIPCLTSEYWITFPDRSGPVLAQTLRMIRKNATKLPRVLSLPPSAQLALEEANVKRCIQYARIAGL